MYTHFKQPDVLPRNCDMRARCLVVAIYCGGFLPLMAQAQERKSGVLEEIVVTAQKREERLQDVPISIAVMSGEDLDRSTLTGVQEELSRVPGMSIAHDFDTNGMQLAVRGVTAAGGKFSGASPIGYYLDSIPFGFIRTAFVPEAAAYDLERIEVLRGPQGTLYGAGGSGGVVRVLTKDADPTEYGFKSRIGLSSVEDGDRGYRGDFVANVPIIEDKLAVRAVVGYEEIPGWIDRAAYTFSSFSATNSLDGPITEKDVNGGDQRNLRLKIKGRPSDQLTIGLSASNSRTRYDAAQSSDENFHTPGVRPEFSRDEWSTYALKVDYQFPSFYLSSMSSYIDYDSSARSRAAEDFFETGLSFDTDQSSRVYAQEIVLNSATESSWRWSAGVFYRDAEDSAVQYYIGKLGDLSDFSRQAAIFGEIGRRFWGDKLEWTLGLRYFHDDVATKSNDNTIPTQAEFPLSRVEDSFDALTPRVVLTWRPSSNLTVYGSYGQGFRSGSQQTPLALNVAPEFPPAKPDKLHNYELGAKGDYWGGGVSFETAVYYIDWKDTQQAVAVVVPGTNESVSATVLVNSVSASGFGTDVALTLRPLKGLEIGASYSWNDLTFDEPLIDGTGFVIFDKGNRLGDSPEYTINPFVAYAFPVGESGYVGRFSADASYISPANTKTGFDRNRKGDAVKIARAGFLIDAPDHWSVGLTVDNLTNYDGTPKAYPTFIEYISYRVRPRTVNLQFEYEW